MMKFLKRYGFELLLQALGWLVVLYILTYKGQKPESPPDLVGSLFKDGSVRKDPIIWLGQYTFFSIFFLMLLFYGNVFLLFNKIGKWASRFNQVLGEVGWFVFVFCADFFLIDFLLKFHSFRTIAFDDYPVEIVSMYWQRKQVNLLLIFLFVMAVSVMYFFAKSWITNELARKRMQANQLSTELKFLKSQINPHFLFNTLNNLFSMAQGKGNDELADGISKLSDMMRYMLYESNTEQVPLKQEIEYLQSAITLSKLRYADDEAEILFSYPEQTDDLLVAPMLFIPFVENAFKHGVLIGQPSTINIAILIRDKQLTFTCANSNYNFVKRMDNVGGIGLENVKRRLELVYPGRHELDIRNEAGTYKVLLKIDLAS